MAPLSLFHADLRPELYAYTVNLLRKVHTRFGVDYEELLLAILGETEGDNMESLRAGPRTCEAILKKNRQPCGRPALEGCERCDVHARAKKPITATHVKEEAEQRQLEYALVHEKPYLIDSIKGDVYTYEKDPTYLGRIELFQAA